MCSDTYQKMAMYEFAMSSLKVLHPLSVNEMDVFVVSAPNNGSFWEILA